MGTFKIYEGYKWYDGPDAVENLPTGPHELHIISYVLELLKGEYGGTLIDVGAHYGLYTVRLSKLFKDVWAFEPHPHNYAILKMNTEANGIKNVKHYNVALWDTDGEAFLAIAHGNPLGKCSGRWLVAEGVGDFKVVTRRLDTLSPPNVRYIKIDVEGHAHRVLAGAEATLNKWHPLVQIEYHSQAEIEGCAKILAQHGYGEIARFDYPPHHLSILQ